MNTKLQHVMDNAIARLELQFDGVWAYSEFKGRLGTYVEQMTAVKEGWTTDEIYGYYLLLYIFEGYLSERELLSYKDILDYHPVRLFGNAVGKIHYQIVEREFDTKEINVILDYLEGKKE